MSLLDVALDCISCGWYVFPCVPRSKSPATKNGFHAATLDEAQVREWWSKNPKFNVAIACGASDLCVLDCDRGIDDGSGKGDGNVSDLMDALDLPVTYTVRTGRTDSVGLQMYFQGAIPDSKFEVRGRSATYSGDIKSAGGYVMAAESIHPSGWPYREEVPWNPVKLPATPDSVRALKRQQPKVDLSSKIESDRNSALTRRAGVLRNAGMTEDLLRETLHRMNEDDCVPPLPSGEVDRIVENALRWKEPEADIPVVIGGAQSGKADGENSPVPAQKRPATLSEALEQASVSRALPEEEYGPLAWMSIFHTSKEFEDAKPPSFLIEGFLQREGVTGITAPVRNRKTLISMNVVHALLTGEPLFGKFPVVERPTRVLYLVPELAIGPFSGNLKKMDLMRFLGSTLFVRTMSKQGKASITDPRLIDALPGSVVFLDTATRFLKGDENSAKDVGVFAQECFDLLTAGAQSVVVLHHTAKAMGDDLKLETMLRGSGDIGAFFASCWGTRLQDVDKPYQSNSYLANLKQRDFQSDPFEVSATDGSPMLTYVEPVGEVVLSSATAFRGDKDGNDERAIAYVRDNVNRSNPDLAGALKQMGIKRSAEWVRLRKKDFRAESGTGARHDG